MDDPVTDVVIVSEPHNCPDGYTVLRECPCGHEAQLWEMVRGGIDNNRYLCFTKKPMSTDKEKDTVIESLYIPGPGVQYLMPFYEVISKTVEGQREPLRHKQLALKRVPRSQAKKVVSDIVVAKGKDSISKKFIRLEKINGVRICFRQEEYTEPLSPTRPSHTMDDMAVGTKNLSLDNKRSRAQTVTPKRIQQTSPPSEIEVRRSSLPEAEYSSMLPIVEEVATVKLVQSLASAPSPFVSTPPVDQSPTDHPPQRYPQPSGQPFEATPLSQYPPAPSSGYQGYQAPSPLVSTPPVYQPRTDHPPQRYPQPPLSQYPPAPSSVYQGSQYPPPARYPQPAVAGYHPQAYTRPDGYPPSYGQPRGVPYVAPPTNVGYDTSIGFSVGGGGSTYPPPPSQYPASQYGRLSGQYPHPPATTPSQPTYPPGEPSTNSHHSYGFNL